MDQQAIAGRLKTLGAGWCRFFHEHAWEYPETLAGGPCLVYSTGFPGWGTWAQLNAALFMATAATWDDALFTGAPEPYRTAGQRRETALALLRYALGYHTTGAFEGAANTRWGGEPKGPDDPEGYNNWHSPLWVVFMAEAALQLAPLPGALQACFERAVAHDAGVQARLGRHVFDGAADELQGRISRPESASWKASLLTLARGLLPDHEDAPLWWARERELWATSLATAEDAASNAMLDGAPLRELAIGHHITPTKTVIHHKFLHPCYMAFPLFSHMQAARFCGRFGLEYPEAAAHNESEVFARLMQFLMPGRLVYPAGKDWPRWVYGQAYLLPLLAHRMRADGLDALPALDALVATRERDAAACHDGSMVMHRFPELLKNNPWDAQRYETDLVASLAQAVTILGGEEPAGRPAQDAVTVTPCYEEPIAKTVYLRRPETAFGMSARAYDGPVQLTAVRADNPHLLEWRGNGALDVPVRSKPRGKYLVDTHTWDAEHAEDGFTARADLEFGRSPFSGPLVRGVVTGHVPPGHDLLAVHQRITALGHAPIMDIRMHTWRIAQETHNGLTRTLAFDNGELHVDAREAVSTGLDSRWLCVDGALTLCVAAGVGEEFVWHVEQPAVRQDDERGIGWLEAWLAPREPHAGRTHPGEVLANSVCVVTFDAEPAWWSARLAYDEVELMRDGAPVTRFSVRMPA